MDYYGIGFSNIRLPNDKNSYIYKYDNRINTFPEEVFLHEFLHSLERNSEEYGYERPKLHDYEKFGYKAKDLIGLKEWYADYMNCRIKNKETGEYVGLNSIVYELKPMHNSNYSNTLEISFFKEPQNVIEEIKEIIDLLFKTIKR
jgi:hypothetical protein